MQDHCTGPDHRSLPDFYSPENNTKRPGLHPILKDRTRPTGYFLPNCHAVSQKATGTDFRPLVDDEPDAMVKRQSRPNAGPVVQLDSHQPVNQSNINPENRKPKPPKTKPPNALA